MQELTNALVAALQAILVVVLPILATFVVQWLKAKVAAVKNGMDADLFWRLEQAALIVVKAAEQMHANETIQDKKKYALALLNDFLMTRGIKLDLNMLEALVESAVLTEFNRPDERPSE